MSTTMERNTVATPPTERRTTSVSGTFGRFRSLVAGHLGLVALLLGTTALYLFGLSRNGYANEYYAAAVQAGSVSWKAWFFGALDASSFVTVDKTPASLWVMGLSGRLFGFGPWSMLVPEALMGVGTVWLLYATVRRWFSPAAGLIAGVVMALTPVAVLMFRFNNPDALLVLLLVAGAWAVTRAIDSVRRPGWWMALAGVLVGFAFLTKMMQAFLVLPAFGLAYLIAGRPGLWARLRHSAGALLAMVGGAGWWVAIVELLPASARPYIGGSQTNSVLELTLGYNGLGRLTGEEAGSVGGRGGWGGPTGIARLFDADMGGQISWLLPAAIIATVVLAVVAGRAGRTDRTRAFAILWGGWLLVTGLVFSYMEGIIHNYYTVALAPAVAALVGAGTVALWRRRDSLVFRLVLSGAVVLTAVWSYVLLNRSPDWHPWLRYAVLVAGLIGAVVLAVTRQPDGPGGTRARLAKRLGVVAALAMAFAGLAGPAAYSVETVSSAHAGALPSAGPATASGGPGGRGPMMMRGPGTTGQSGQFQGPPPGQGVPGQSSQGQSSQGQGTQGQGSQGQAGQAGPGTRTGGFLGGAGISQVSAELITMLQNGSSGHRWAAAAVTANGAAPLQIASGVPVMAIGGFNGTDPTPTLEEFKALVAQGKIHYFVGTGSGAGMGPANGGGSRGTSSEISSWVADNYTAQTVGGYTVYDLTTGTTT